MSAFIKGTKVIGIDRFYGRIEGVYDYGCIGRGHWIITSNGRLRVDNVIAAN